MRFTLLVDETKEVLAYCDEAAGIDGKLWDEDNYSLVTFRGVTLCGSLRKRVEKSSDTIIGLDELIYGKNSEEDGCRLRIIDSQSTEVRPTILKWLGFDLSKDDELQITACSFHYDYHCPDNQPYYNYWKSGKVSEKGIWFNDSTVNKEIWLEYVSHFTFLQKRKEYLSLQKSKDKKNGRYELDGQIITDHISFYLALGEAINGAGGYFGSNLGAVDDCLCGDFGAIPPFTLKWLNHDFSKQHLMAEQLNETSYWEHITEILEGGGVRIEYL